MQIRDVVAPSGNRLLKAPPNFEPTLDFKRWDNVVPNDTFQRGQR